MLFSYLGKDFIQIIKVIKFYTAFVYLPTAKKILKKLMFLNERIFERDREIGREKMKEREAERQTKRERER